MGSEMCIRDRNRGESKQSQQIPFETFRQKEVIKIDPVFISIDDDIFNVGEIQVLSYEDKKNELGKDSGVYVLHIYMKNEIGSMNKMFSNKQMRDKVFRKAADQLLEFSSEKTGLKRKKQSNSVQP